MVGSIVVAVVLFIDRHAIHNTLEGETPCLLLGAIVRLEVPSLPLVVVDGEAVDFHGVLVGTGGVAVIQKDHPFGRHLALVLE